MSVCKSVRVNVSRSVGRLPFKLGCLYPCLALPLCLPAIRLFICLSASLYVCIHVVMLVFRLIVGLSFCKSCMPAGITHGLSACLSERNSS